MQALVMLGTNLRKKGYFVSPGEPLPLRKNQNDKIYWYKSQFNMKLLPNITPPPNPPTPQAKRGNKNLVQGARK